MRRVFGRSQFVGGMAQIRIIFAGVSFGETGLARWVVSRAAVFAFASRAGATEFGQIFFSSVLPCWTSRKKGRAHFSPFFSHERQGGPSPNTPRLSDMASVHLLSDMAFTQTRFSQSLTVITPTPTAAATSRWLLPSPIRRNTTGSRAARLAAPLRAPRLA